MTNKERYKHQLAYRLRLKVAGRCINCGEERKGDANFCENCRVKRLNRRRWLLKHRYNIRENLDTISS